MKMAMAASSLEVRRWAAVLWSMSCGMKSSPFGMTKDDFNVRIDEDNNLVISMEKKTENKEERKDGRYLRREFSYSKFQQTMILPDNVDKEKIAASVEHGVLNIELPKLSEEEVKKPNRQIEIK